MEKAFVITIWTNMCNDYRNGNRPDGWLTSLARSKSRCGSAAEYRIVPRDNIRITVPYHDYQVVVLAPEKWAAWLGSKNNERDILIPSPSGTLTVALEST